MTAQKERTSSTPVLARVTLLATLGLAACNTVADSPAGADEPGKTAVGDGDGDTGDGDKTPGTGDGDTGDGDGDTPPPNGDCDGELNAAAKDVVVTYCTQCHGEVPVNNGFASIDDAKALVSGGKVIPDDPDNSPLFLRLSSNSMPPASVEKRPGQADIDTIRSWIACGAADWNDTGELPVQKFISIDERLNAMRNDLRSISNPADREDVRYIDLTTLANAGASLKQLDEYRDAVSFLINSLSQGQRVVAPEAIDSDKLIYRLDITDYGWDENTWNLLTANYPYSVIYDEDSEIFPFDETSAEQIRDETNEDIPYIQADWFLANASESDLYLRLLGLPADGENLQVLEDLLGIDIVQNIQDEQVDRAGFLNSDPSDANRMLERHELPGNQGGFWISYDFANNLAEEGNDIFADPLTFTADGGEALFHLPNGLLAYYVVAGNALAGTAVELDIAPIGVVQDPNAFDGQVRTGRSCLTCHVNGELAKQDQRRESELTNGAADLDTVLALFPSNDEMADIYEEDQNRYRTALAALNISHINERTMHSVHQRHLDELSAADVASVLGISTEDLLNGLDFAVAQVPSQFLALRSSTGLIDRDVLDQGIGDLAEAIGLGNKVVPQN